LLNVVDGIYQSLNDLYFVTGMYFDLQKAFDTVDHDILVKKLNNYDIRGKMLDWFTNYLSNRS